jgi:hypothetical protein
MSGTYSARKLIEFPVPQRDLMYPVGGPCPLWVKKQTFAPQKAMSALPLIATAKADFPQTVMSAFPRKRTFAVHLGMGQERMTIR